MLGHLSTDTFQGGWGFTEQLTSLTKTDRSLNKIMTTVDTADMPITSPIGHTTQWTDLGQLLCSVRTHLAYPAVHRASTERERIVMEYVAEEAYWLLSRPIECEEERPFNPLPGSARPTRSATRKLSKGVSL